ncbi:MAG: BatA domain-containing protein [Bacteroidales bacterium]|nr:BatA domain-containing protein [Bacteroidales bacterium]
MEFVNPGFLYALSAVAIPVIIHLFNFRRFRKVYFTNIKFLSELKQKTQKQSRLKHLLVLLMRILAIIAIVFAFARPFIPASETVIKPDKKNAVAIYIDNSFSMQSGSDVGNLLDKANTRAKEIVSVYSSSDVFQILTNEFDGGQQRLVSQEETGSLIDEVVISPVVRNLNDVITRQSDLLSKEFSANRTAFIISDFQKSVVPEKIIIPDSMLNVFFIPVRAINTDNLYIDSCWFSVPVQLAGQNVEMNVRIINHADNEYKQIPVKLTIDGQQKALAGFDISAQDKKIVKLPFTNTGTGIYAGMLEITDYPVNFDDKFYFSYHVSSQINILIINQNRENVYLNSLFRNDELFRVTNESAGSIDYSALSSYNLIILNELRQLASGFGQELIQFVENGGSLLILPAMNMEDQEFNSMLTKMGSATYRRVDSSDTKISSMNLDHPIFSDVFDEIPENIDLPVVRESFVIIANSQSRQEPLLTMQSGNLFLNVQPWKDGKIYLFASPLEEKYSNFAKHAIFVPTLYKIAVSSSFDENLYYTIGQNEVITLRNKGLKGDEIFRISNKNSDFEFIPEHRRVNSNYELYIHSQVKNAGNYAVIHDDREIEGISFNYDPAESKLDFFTQDELTAMAANSLNPHLRVLETSDQPIVRALEELNQGKQLWWWFVILALVFFAAETLLLRFRR